MSTAAFLPAWRLVIPVKNADLAKSRLQAPAGVPRQLLARALALDTIEAVVAGTAPAHLVVVTSDPRTAAAASALGTLVEPDPGAGLDQAVLAGAARTTSEHDGGPVAILLGDLPALRTGELRTALAEAASHRRAFVPDAAGTGTVLLTAAAGVPLRPRFGPGSAARHERLAARLELDLPSLRTDVDEEADLAHVLELGVGRHTNRVLRAGPAADVAG